MERQEQMKDGEFSPILHSRSKESKEYLKERAIFIRKNDPDFLNPKCGPKPSQGVEK